MARLRETLLQNYIRHFSKERDENGTNVKIFVTCRSSYLSNDDDDRWFTLKSGALTKRYIAPLGYGLEKKNHKSEMLAEFMD